MPAQYPQTDDHGIHIGVDYCRRYLIPLAAIGTSAATSAALKEEFGKACQDFGRPLDEPSLDTFTSRRLHVGTGTPVTIGDKKPPACTACAYYVTQVSALEVFGLPHPLCAATGAMVPVGAAAAHAKNCDLGKLDYDHSEAHVGADWLLPGYRDSIVIIDPNAPVTVRSAAAQNPDPASYVSDREVTAEHKESGIRAWRRLDCPEDPDRHIFMPIFDPGYFAEEERALIPQPGAAADDPHPESYDDHAGLLYAYTVLWHLGQVPAVIGSAGTGKTESYRYAAWSMGAPFHRISITGSTELDELAGRMELRPGYTEFQYGRVATAWTRPGVLAIDEPNTAPPEVWQFLRPMLDSGELHLDANRGERLLRHRHCMVGLSFNPSHDLRNVGTHDIGEADASRLVHIALGMPTRDKERDIIASAVARYGYQISSQTMETILDVAAEVRSLAADAAFPVHWGIREQIKVALLAQWWPLRRAYLLAMGDFLPPADREQLLGIVGSHDAVSVPKGRTPVS